MEKNCEVIDDGQCPTIHKFSYMIGISYGTCQEILTECLNKHHIVIFRKKTSAELLRYGTNAEIAVYVSKGLF